MQKKRVIPLLLAGVFAAASVIGGSAPPVMAEGEGNLIDPTRKCSVSLRYLDEPESGEAGKGINGKTPVVGAEFTLYKIAVIHDRVRIHLAEGDDALPVAERVIPEPTEDEVPAEDAAPAEDASGEEATAEGDAAAGDESGDGTAAEDAGTAEDAAAPEGTDAGEDNASGEEEQPAEEFVQEQYDMIARDYHTGNGYVSLIDGIQVHEALEADEALVSAVQKAYGGSVEDGATYKAVTDSSGLAAFDGIDQGVYLVVETKAAKEHYESAPFLISVPITSDDGTTWIYDREAYPKPLPAGDLIISKTVGGTAGEKTKEFHFTVAFEYSGSYKDSHPATYHYTKSDKKEGQMKESDVIVLKDGESITIDTIPVGTKYKVTEREANADGYKTTVKDESKNSTIMRTVQSKVSFTNTKDAASKAGAAGGGTAGTGRVQTGDLVLPIALAGGGILAAVIILVAALRKRKGGN